VPSRLIKANPSASGAPWIVSRNPYHPHYISIAPDCTALKPGDGQAAAETGP
jgi:hypothetical protein